MLDSQSIEEACDGLQAVLIVLTDMASDAPTANLEPAERAQMMADLNLLARAIVHVTDAASLLQAGAAR